jgi:signal transduction histidine kinase
MKPRHENNEAENNAEAALLQARLDQAVQESLGPTSLGLFFGMLLLVISHAIFLPPGMAQVMMLSAGACALFFLAGYLLARLGRVSVQASNPLALAGAALLSFNSLLHLYLSGNPAQTTNLALVLIGVGIFFLSPGWYTAAMTLTMGSWWMTSWAMGQGAAWFHFNFLMVLAGLISVLAFYLRRRALLSVELLRLRSEQQRQQLELAQRQAEANLLALRQAKEMAEAANLSKTTFLTMMSHDLRTPLTVILGYSEMLRLQAEMEGQDEVAARIAQVENAGRQLLSMLNDILDYARLETEQLQVSPEPVQPALLAVQAADAIGHKIEKRGNRLELAVGSDLGEMRADPQRLHQVLRNLLNHAANATENGVVRLSAWRETDPSGRAWVVFEAADDGPGLSPQQASSLFEPFPSGELAQVLSASGSPHAEIDMGLAISQRLCRLMGGDLTAQSAPGVGTTLTARFPAEASHPHSNP